MLILALDSTATTASVALCDDNNTIASFHIHNKLTHSEKLLPMIDSVLNYSGYKIGDVQLISVSNGPGSFTGVRIGCATVKGLSFSGNIPVCAVSSLDALAENFTAVKGSTVYPEFVIASCMDARRNELYASLFLYKNGRTEKLTQDEAVSCENLLTEIRKYDLPAVFNGDGAEKMYSYTKSLDKDFNCMLAEHSLLLQNAESVARLGYKKYINGESISSDELCCYYLRASQAERLYKENKGE